MVFLDPSRADCSSTAPGRFSAARRRSRSTLARPAGAFAGPTAIASVAYLDPGNFATNITAGATHGYQLLWVVLARQSHGDAVPGAVGQARHRLRPQPGAALPRALPRRLTSVLWVVSEVGAMATDLAELLGASIGCALLLGTSLLDRDFDRRRSQLGHAYPARAELPGGRGDHRAV